MNLIIENSVIEESYAFKLLEKIVDENPINVIMIDKSLQDLSEFSEINEKVLKVKSYIKLFEKIASVEVIETKNFKMLEPLEKAFDQYNELVMVTQNEAIAKGLRNYFDKKNLRLTRFENGNIQDWKVQKINLNAFFVEKNRYKFGLIDSKKIDYVFSPKYGYLKLDESPIYSGGEGEIFKTYQGFVAKIYKPSHQSYNNYKKLKQMVNTPINNHLIVWPKDLIYQNGVFVGYIMEHIQGVGSMDDLRDKGSEVFSYKDRIQIVITFLKNIKYLHDRNILVGDMKFDNTLVKSPEEVYIIDTGSFQIEDYPCVVYNASFSEKKYTNDELKKQLRTIESEYYPINKITFETFFFKSPYYSQDNIEVGEDENREFNLSLNMPDDKSKIKSYERPWYAIPLKLRENFYYYFKEKKITYLAELIHDFENFKNSLEREKSV